MLFKKSRSIGKYIKKPFIPSYEGLSNDKNEDDYKNRGNFLKAERNEYKPEESKKRKRYFGKVIEEVKGNNNVNIVSKSQDYNDI